MGLTELSRIAAEYWVVWLMAVFIGIVVWTFWPSRKRSEQMRDHAQIPFREDEEPPGNDRTQ